MNWFRRSSAAVAIVLLFILCFTAAYADGGTLCLPESVTVIEEEAFYGDASLNEVVLPQGIEEIGPRAFANSSLSRINLPDSLDSGSIASDAFDDSQLQQVVVSYQSSAGDWAREHQNSLGYEIVYDAGENSVTSGAAFDISATAAWVPLTYSVDVETAENGYRMGVAYSLNADDIGIDNDGFLTCMEWTWGNEIGVYGPANHVGFDGWLDEMIPGHTYWYSGCIVDSDSRVLFLEDSVRSFTTGSADPVQELSLDGEHGTAPGGDAKTPFRFTAPTEGWYVLIASHEMNEISLRRMDQNGCGWANDCDRVIFFAGENETVYAFTRDFTEDAEVWIEAAEVPEYDSVVSEIDLSGDAPVARVTLNVSGNTALGEYGFGVEYSPNENFCDENNNRLAYDFFWRFGDYRVRMNETLESGYMSLIPGVTYYYRGFIDYCNGEPRLVEDEVHSFTAPGNVEDIPALTLETWSDIPADQETLFRFTAPEVGWYAVQAEGMYYCNILQNDGSVLRGTNDMENNDHNAVLVLGMGEGETCYIRTRGMESARIRVTQDRSVFFQLTEEPQWVWDNRFVCFTAPDAGWYNLKVERTDLGGILMFANLPHDDYSFWFNFYGDVDTQSIHAFEAGDTFYFITWYDMSQNEQRISIEPITPPEEDSISVTNVQLNDTRAGIGLEYSVSAATQDLACNRHGYQVGVVYSDSEIHFDSNNNYYTDNDEEDYYGLFEDWGWDSRFSIEDGATLTRWLDRLIPNTTYYYFAYIKDAQTGELFAHTDPASFTTAPVSTDVTTLSLGQEHEINVPEGDSVFRFVPEQTDIYAVVSSNLEYLEIRGESGRWVAGDSYYDLGNQDYPYAQGFIGEAGHEYYIFVGNHFDDVTLFVGCGDDELPELTGQWPGQWYDGRQVFRFTPSADGWYRFTIDATDQGEICFAEPEHMYDNGGWPRYGEGNEVTRWLEAGQTVYPGCWFDNEWTWLRMIVTTIVPAAEVSVTTLDVLDVTDVTALFGIELGMPELNVNEGANYTYGVMLLRCDNDPDFTGGTAWQNINSDMSMVEWNQTAPLEPGYQHFFDERPLEPDTSYWYEAFVGVYDPLENQDTFYYGGLKTFRTEVMQHAVTAVTENQQINVQWLDGDYQFFDFTVPQQDAADFYDITVPESSIWVIQPDGIALWPDWTDYGLHCVIPGKGNEGQTFRICLKVWNQNGTSFTVQAVNALNVEVGSGLELSTGTVYCFTAPTDGEYLIGATDGGRINAYLSDNGGFNHQNGWGWITDIGGAGEKTLFRCEQDNGNQTTEVVITPLENTVMTEAELQASVAAANQISQVRPYFEGFNIYVNGDIELSQNMELSTVVQLHLNAALTVPGSVKLTEHGDVYIMEGGSLSVAKGGWFEIHGVVNADGDIEWWSSVNLFGGTFTENGTLWIDQAAIISVDAAYYSDVTEALSSIQGNVTVPQSLIQLYVGVESDAELQQVKTLMNEYKYIVLRLTNGFSSEISALTDFTADKAHIVADESTSLTVPASSEQTLCTTLRLEGASLTVDGTLNMGTQDYEGVIDFLPNDRASSFVNNGNVNVGAGSGFNWYGPVTLENNGTMSFADHSFLRIPGYDSTVTAAEVDNADGTVNLGNLDEWTAGITFAGGTVNTQ